MADAIRKDFYVGPSSTLVHLPTGFKIDIFPASSDAFGQQQLKRRRLAGSLPVISAEDTILVKLRWYRDGGKSSERQWNDLRNIVKVQGKRIDFEYLREWSRELQVADLLAALLNEELE